MEGLELHKLNDVNLRILVKWKILKYIFSRGGGGFHPLKNLHNGNFALFFHQQQKSFKLFEKKHKKNRGMKSGEKSVKKKGLKEITEHF